MTARGVSGLDRFAEVKRRYGFAELVVLAEAEGLRHSGSGSNRCECPGCRDGDPRGASVGERDGVGVWNCHRDERHCGSAIDFFAFARGIDTVAARDELERIAGIDPSAAHPPPPAPRKPAAPPTYPAAEVITLWEHTCRPLSLVPEVAAAWEARKIDVAHVEDRSLARALPSGVEVPRWAYGAGQSWNAGAHRLIVPLYDCHGRLASLHARTAAAPKGSPKGLSPLGRAVAGLVMADPTARLMLSGAPCGDGTPSAELVRRCGLVVAEGVPDFLTWATRWGDAAEGAPAVIGIIAGSWTAAVAARVPSGTAVFVRAHADDAGAKYARLIEGSIEDRCTVRTVVSEKVPR